MELEVIKDQGAALSAEQKLSWLDPLEVRVALTRESFQNVLLKVWLLRVPNTDSIFTLLGGY